MLVNCVFVYFFIYDKFFELYQVKVELLKVGDLMDFDMIIGLLINSRQMDGLMKIVE